MKLLIWIEPIYIRDSKVTFAWIAGRFVSALTALMQTNVTQAQHVKIFCNRATAEHIQADENLMRQGILLPTSEEEMRLEKAFPLWHTEGYARWAMHMEGKDEYSEGYLSMLERVWNDFPFDAILHWGTSRFIKQFAQERKIVPLFAELGPIRPPFLSTGVVDGFGVNGDSCFADGKMAVLGASVVPQALRYPPFSARSAGERERYVLFPLQTQDDANILVHNGGKDYVHQILDAAERATSLGWRCLVKPHPGAALSKYNYDADQDFFKKLRMIPGIEFLSANIDPGNYRSLLEKAAGIVTFNSSVGCEASLLGTPTHVIARAGYAPPGRFADLDHVLSGIEPDDSWLSQMSDIHETILNRYLLPIDRVFDLHHMFKVAIFWRDKLFPSSTAPMVETLGLFSTLKTNILRKRLPRQVGSTAAPDHLSPLGLELTADS